MDNSKNGGPNHLRDWRDFRKLTQEDLAHAAGTTASVVSMLENGERQLSAKWLRRLAPCLETTPGLLLDHNPYDLDASILEIWNNADKGEQRQIIALAETVLNFRHKPAA
ncbi:helix-turn-helix transcriptional regulator [Sandarakinorhabdus sp.]|uniref:helix-turn-helix domain-containing protein n=1 Tax=Sandarakinorhabdus sp. TaxID=1916663 RepID=UPI00286E1BC6|nr:helix-turn-helix transcriptional regulator [Sandarakinorhabdus sp.]